MKTKTPKQAKDLVLAVLSLPEFHYRACYEDISGRPQPFSCICPMKEIMEKVVNLPED